MDLADLATPIAAVSNELTLFAAVGLLVGGVDDLTVDAIYLWRRLRRWRVPHILLTDLPAPVRRFAMFVPAWDESVVIGAMLTSLTTRVDAPRLTIYVGTYPNDPATIRCVRDVATYDPRVRLVVGARAGPTTKADCLNSLWRAMLADEAAGAERHDAVVLHDAEDVVHRGELMVFDRWLDDADAVQIPVLPLARAGAHMVGGTYLDEFAEPHWSVPSEAIDPTIVDTARPVNGER